MSAIPNRKPKRFISRDEMNLAEFPLTVLSTRSDPRIKTLEFSDTIYTRDGKPTERKWIITGADKFGLPTSSDDEVLLGLLKLTVESEFQSRKIFFTRYELLKILRWTTEGRSYTRLQNALDRLSGVRIKASNAFFDNESKAHSTRNFGILDAYEINDGRDSNPKPSFFIWSEVLFKSFQAGFIKKLDLDFFLSLRSAVSRRLYRYLDKHFWYRSKLKCNLFTLAHEKIGISRNYKYPSSIRQQLDPAIEELIEEGFLASCEYEGRGKGTEVVFYAASGKPRKVLGSEDGAGSSDKRSNGSARVLQLPLRDRVVTEKGQNGVGERSDRDLSSNGQAPVSRATVAEFLQERGIQERQVVRLIGSRSEIELQRIEKIIEHYDRLLASGSHLLSKSPVGFLYRAVEHPERFVLPGETRQAPLKLKNKKQKSFSKLQSGGREPRARDAEKLQAGDSRAQYLVWRKKELTRLRETVEPELLERIQQEVGTALKKIKGMISPENYQEAVDHGVEERVAKLLAVPTFEEWLTR